MTGTELIAKILKQEGIDMVTCFPSNELIEALSKEDIRPVMFRHERGAIMAADGFSRMNDRKKFGVALMQHQAGAENSVGAIAQAFSDNVPILVLPGGNPIERNNVSPNFSAKDNYKNIVKSVETIYTPTQISDVMRRAFHALRNGPPGPVVVEMSIDICEKEVPKESCNYYSPNISKNVPSSSDIKDAVKLILNSKNPMIWAGAGVLNSGGTNELKELAELIDIPVFTTMEGKSSIDERHYLSLGAGSGATTWPAHKWIQESDLVLGIGTSLTINNYTQQMPEGKLVIHNTISPYDVNKDTPSELGLLGDSKLTMLALIDEIKGVIGEKGKKTNVSKKIAEEKNKWMNEWNPLLTSEEKPLNTYRVIHEINNTINRENSVVTHDAGAPRDSIVPFYIATTPHSYIGWGKTTHLGFGIPLAIGAKLASPDKFCLNFMGDGAFGMSGTDVETAGRISAPITTVLLNNKGMATYPGGFPLAQEKYGISHMVGDYALIAEGMGAKGIKAEDPLELREALIKAIDYNNNGKSVLIDVNSNMEPKKSRF
jgi:thiamine pyrophosphate-dependent acetolactate synthase large subunit-like protein